MKSKKGFTLVELLAVIVILGVILLIAVPSVLSMVDKNKKELYIADAEKMITMAEYAIRTNTNIILPDETEILVMPLSTIQNGDLKTDPEGYQYSETSSYVAITNNDGFTDYWVNLVGEGTAGNRGVYLCNSESLKGSNRFDVVVSDMTVPVGEEIARVICGSTTCRGIRTYTG